MPESLQQSKESSWTGYVVPKALEMMNSGGVTVLYNTPNYIQGHVVGWGTDNKDQNGNPVPDEHNPEIYREDPESQAITQWNCDCKWAQHAFGRTRKWKKYNGRCCSHVLALWWSARSHPMDASEQEPGYQVPRGQKGPETPEQQPVNPQMQLPGLEETGPQVSEPEQGPIAIPPQPFPKVPQQQEKYPQRQQLYLWDLTSVPGQETPAEFVQQPIPPEQRTQTLQMPGAFSSVRTSQFQPGDFVRLKNAQFPTDENLEVVEHRGTQVAVLMGSHREPRPHQSPVWIDEDRLEPMSIPSANDSTILWPDTLPWSDEEQEYYRQAHIKAIDVPRFRVIQGDFTWTAADDFEQTVQEMLREGRTPTVQILRPVELEARGGKHPMPEAQPLSLNSENTPVYNVLDLGWNPETGQRDTADTPTAGAPEQTGVSQMCPQGKRGIILSLEPALKWAYISVPLHESGPLHPHSLVGYVSYKDIKLIPEAGDPYRAGY